MYTCGQRTYHTPYRGILSTPVGKGITTHIKIVRTLSCIYVTMSIQRTPLDKGLSKLIKDVRLLSSMNITMSIQRNPLAKGLITQLQT
jgi:hypothetical protein